MHEDTPWGRLRTWEFWRNQAVYLCVFSLVGHWFEIPYCCVMDALFGIVDPETLVWDDFTYPFPVYGIGAVVCAILLEPLRDRLIDNCPSWRFAAVVFYIGAVFVACGMELAQGFLQNQPDENGVYPLWDNSQLPFNVLGQAWLVNDVFIALIILWYVWWMLPTLERCIAKLPPKVANVGAAVVVVAFVVLCICKFS